MVFWLKRCRKLEGDRGRTLWPQRHLHKVDCDDDAGTFPAYCVILHQLGPCALLFPAFTSISFLSSRSASSKMEGTIALPALFLSNIIRASDKVHRLGLVCPLDAPIVLSRCADGSSHMDVVWIFDRWPLNTRLVYSLTIFSAIRADTLS